MPHATNTSDHPTRPKIDPETLSGAAGDMAEGTASGPQRAGKIGEWGAVAPESQSSTKLPCPGSALRSFTVARPGAMFSMVFATASSVAISEFNQRDFQRDLKRFRGHGVIALSCHF